jgi:flagellar biosynthesis protein FlhB
MTIAFVGPYKADLRKRLRWFNFVKLWRRIFKGEKIFGVAKIVLLEFLAEIFFYFF